MLAIQFRMLRTAICVSLPALFLAMIPAPASAASATATRTTLAITTGTGADGSVVTAVSESTAVTLTATVKAGAAVPAGQVNFCDATAAHCTDIHLKGVAYLTASGTATLTFAPGPGVHSYVAEYAGTSGITGPSQTAATVYAASSSAASSLTVGSVATTTTIAQSGAAGAYTLKATVAGKGSATGPTGKVSFLDTNNQNAVLGSASLGTASSALSWTTPESPATAAQPNSIAVADFNGDGVPDLAIATNGISGGNGSVQILLGNGDGTFQTAKTYAGLPGVQVIVAAPFITGGPEDLLVVNNATPASANSSFEDNGLLFTGDGKGNFQAGTPFVACLNFASGVVVGDFNRDGIPDFAVAGYLNGGTAAAVANVAVTYGDGTGTFPTLSTGCSAQTILAIFNGDPSPAITALGVGDFQGNGEQDIATVQTNGAITIFLQDAGSAYPYPFAAGPNYVTQTAGPSATGIAVGDFNGDGYADLAITNAGGNNVTILLGDGTGTNFTAAASPTTGSKPAAIAVGDFNGDGIDDLAVANSGDGTETILLGKGDGTFSALPAINAGNTPFAVAVGTFNGSGTADTAVVNQVPDSTVAGTATLLLSQLTQTATATATNISPLGTGTTHLADASYAGDDIFAGSISATTSLAGAGGTEVVTVAPSSLTFTALAVGSSSAAQAIAVTNSGSVAVSVTSIAAAGDFSETNNCGSSLAVGGNCAIAVVFTPTTSGTRSGTLSIADNATGSPQTVALTGTGTSVSVVPGSTSLTINAAGGSATDAITISSAQGFSGTVNLSCAVTYQGTGTPTDPPTCSIAPSSGNVTGAAALAATLKVSTTGAGSSQTAAIQPQQKPIGGTSGFRGALLPAGVSFAALLFAGFLPRRRWREMRFVILLACSLGCVFTAIGCGGGSNQKSTGTTTGSYQVVVTATSGTLTVTSTIALTVQ